MLGSTICSKEAAYPAHLRFWCDSDITFLRGLHEKLATVLYFSIINVFCLINLYGAGGDASFASQANLVIVYSGDVPKVRAICCFLDKLTLTAWGPPLYVRI